MQITLYVTKSEKNKINKVLTLPANVEGHIKGRCDVLRPVIELQNASFDISNVQYNYAYIPLFKRYYFVHITFENNTKVLELTVDPLMSWKTDILASTCHATRSSKGNKDFNDEMVRSGTKYTYEVSELGNGFASKDQFVMIVAGSI